MAFDSKWQGADSATDYSVAGNWDGGVPANAEDALIGDSAANITSGMAQGGVDLALWETGPKFSGTIGTSASPLVMGDTTVMRINSPRARTINASIDAAHTCTTCYVLGANHQQYGVYLQGPGTYTSLFVFGGQHITIAADATVTNLYMLGGNLWIESGATITNVLRMERGSVYCSATISTAFQMNGGIWTNEGDSTEGNMPASTVNGGTLRLDCKNATITSLTVGNTGIVDGTRYSHENTVSAGTLYWGGTIKLNNQTIVSANIANYGGIYKGPEGTVDEKLPSPV